MATKTAPIDTFAAKLIGRWEQAGNKVATLAEEFPEDAYEYRPVEGVRTFAEVLRHVAFWNMYVAATARGEKADEEANELPKPAYPTKNIILEALRKSIAGGASALRARPAEKEPETAELVAAFLEHTCEHYGQLVVYTRMKGIVPLAGRG